VSDPAEDEMAAREKDGEKRIPLRDLHILLQKTNSNEVVILELLKAYPEAALKKGEAAVADANSDVRRISWLKKRT
jgi:predicted kinase